MTDARSNIARLSAAFRDMRLALGLDLEDMSAELGIPTQVMEAIESCDWSGITSDKAYDLSVAIAGRLGLDLESYSIDRAFFFGDLKSEGTRPGDLRREKTVMAAMIASAAAMLAWLLIPAKDISQPPPKEDTKNTAREALWQHPVSDLPYPVLGEVFPEAPITQEGVLISLRATDICNVRIETERGGEQSQMLRMSEPWKLRAGGSFVLHLDNAGVVSVEVAGQKIMHGVGVGQAWSGAFDAHGLWLTAPKPAPPVRVIRESVEGLSEESINQ